MEKIESINEEGLGGDPYATGHGAGNDTRADPELGHYVFNICIKSESCPNSQ